MYDYIVDSHCHLDLLQDKGYNVSDVVNNAHQSQVKLLQTICTQISQINRLLSFADDYPNVYTSIGNHPCNTNQEELCKSEDLVKFINEYDKIIGIGETGLDYFHDQSFIKIQKSSFVEHIKASQISKLPVIIHSREADDDMASILRSEQKNAYFPALLHCFSSGKGLSKTALDLGIYISVSGIVTFKNAVQLQEIVKYIPLQYLLVETDSPYLAPMPHRGKVNEPAFTEHVVDFIAQIKNVSRETIIGHTTANFHKIFTRTKSLNSNDK